MDQSVTYKRERVHDLWDEVMPLLHEHYQEIAHHKDIPLSPDFEQYDTLEQAGMLRCYTVRVDGALVGYAAFLIKHHPHYMTSLQAHQDVLFLMPDYRANRIGLGLIKYSETELFNEGAELVGQHVKAGHPALGEILEKDGYELVDLIYVKRRGD